MHVLLTVSIALLAPKANRPPTRPAVKHLAEQLEALVPLQKQNSHRHLPGRQNEHSEPPPIDLMGLEKLVRRNAETLEGKTLLSVLIHLKDRRQWQLALTLAQMLEANYSPSDAAEAAALLDDAPSYFGDEECARAAGDGGSAFKAGRSLPPGPLQTVHYNVLLASLAPARRWQEAIELMERMRKRGIPRETVTYNSLLNVLEHGGRWKLAMKTLRRMRKEDVPPDTITFTSAISACSKQGEWRTALLLMHTMRAAGVEPNTITYTAAIAACERAGEWKRALRLLLQMRERGVEPDQTTFNTAIGACGRAGEYQRALSLRDDMVSAGVEPNVITYNCLITAHANAAPPLVERARELLAEMEEVHGLTPDLISHNAHLAALAHAGDAVGAIEKVDGLHAATGLTPDAISLTTAISACAEAGAWEEAVELLGQLRASGARLSTLPYSKTIAALAKGGRWQQACGLLQTISSEGLSHNALTTNLVLGACEAAGQHVAALSELATLFEHTERQRRPYAADEETLALALKMLAALEAADAMHELDGAALAAVRSRVPRIQVQLRRAERARVVAAEEAAELERELAEAEAAEAAAP